mgnify:CR=1 FL=1
MCEIYILIAFALGLFSGWLANFLLSGKYIDKALDSYYSEEQKQEMKENFHEWADTVMQGFKKRLRESGRLIES